MNLEELRGRVRQMAAAARAKIGAEMEVVAVSGYALVQRRASQTGKDAQGSAFEPYSPEYERYKRGAVGVAKKEGKKKRAARKTAEATAENPVGRFTGFVNFTLSGQMLNSIGITEAGFRSGAYVVRVGGRDQETKDKMAGNDKNRKGWLRLQEKEKTELRDQSSKRMGNWARGFLNG